MIRGLITGTLARRLRAAGKAILRIRKAAAEQDLLLCPVIYVNVLVRTPVMA